jgi:uncharacterized membrane protein
VEKGLPVVVLVISVVVLSLPFLLMAAYHASPEMARMCPMCAAMMPVGPFFGILFAVGIVGVLLALVLMLAASTSGSRQTGQTYLGLLEKERRVVELLSERGAVTQRDIARELAISRVRAHRLIRELERRGIVTTEPRGRTKIVRLRQGSSEG